MSNFGDRLFDEEGKERIDGFFNVDLLSPVKNFFDESENVFVDLCFAVVEEIEEGIAITINDIRNVLWEKFVDSPDHGDTLMSIGPIIVFEESVDFEKEILVEDWRLFEVVEVDFRHFNRLGKVIHQNSNLYLTEPNN